MGEVAGKAVISPARRRDAAVLEKFVRVYCREHRHAADGALCPACEELLAYAMRKLEKCPMNPKPKCKDCPVHCYQPTHRRAIGEVMKFSGMYFAKRGRLDWLLRYFWK